MFESLENKRFNDIVEKYIAPEHRYLTENLTDSQRNVLRGFLAITQDTPTEEQLRNIIQDTKDIPPDPEHETLMKKVNDTATLKAALPFVGAESPVRFNTDEVNDTEIPFTAPGQILIYVSAETESTTMFPPDWKSGDPIDPDIQYNETLPNSWSGNI